MKRGKCVVTSNPVHLYTHATAHTHTHTHTHTPAVDNVQLINLFVFSKELHFEKNRKTHENSTVTLEVTSSTSIHTIWSLLLLLQKKRNELEREKSWTWIRLKKMMKYFTNVTHTLRERERGRATEICLFSLQHVDY